MRAQEPPHREVRPQGSPAPAASSQAGRPSTSPDTSSGRVAAIRSAIAAPIEMPPTGSGASPSASISAIRSSAKLAIAKPSGGPASDRPCPRHSSVTACQPIPSGNTSAGCAASPPSPCWNSIGRPPPHRATESASPARGKPRPPHQTSAARNRATPGASAAVSPWVTSAPSNPARRSAAR